LANICFPRKLAPSGRTFAQDGATSVVAEAPAAAVAAGGAERELPLGEIAAAVLDSCRRVADAA